MDARVTSAPRRRHRNFQGLSAPAGIAIDTQAKVWAANAGGSSICEFSSSGSPVSSTGYSGGGLNGPYCIAVDGYGNIWAASSGNNSISDLSSSGTPVSGSNGCKGGALSDPNAIAIDGSGEVWIANQPSKSITEFVGVATPVVTPIVANLRSPYGVHAVNEP